MGIERAAVLYPRNSTVVDTGGGADVRLLDDVNGSTVDQTQTAQATHTQDNQEFSMDPANNTASTVNAATTLSKLGWALRLAEDMTPTDDTNCNAFLPAGTMTVDLAVTLTRSGGTYVNPSYGPTWRVGLWRYNPSTDTGTLIIGGNATSPTWVIAGGGSDLGVIKIATATLIVPDTEFSDGEILLLQVGFNTGTIPNPSLGTGTFTFILAVDYDETSINWASGQGIRQKCSLTNSLDGRGTATRQLAGAMSRSATGKGESTVVKAATLFKEFTVDGRGVPTHNKLISEDFDVTGIGTPSGAKATVASKSFDVMGTGEVIDRNIHPGINRTLDGRGTPTSSKASTVAKSFDIVGKGIVTELHPVTAFRTFNLVGTGEVTPDSSITIPIDEVPTGGGGEVINHIFGILE